MLYCSRLMRHLLYILLFCTALSANDEFRQEFGDSFVSDPNISDIDRGFYQDRYYVNIHSSQTHTILVDTYTGNLFVKRTDFVNSSTYFPLNAEFYYNSGSSFEGHFGYQWQFKYSVRFTSNNFNGNIIVSKEDDKSLLFKFNRDSLRFESIVFDSLYQGPQGLVLDSYYNSFYDSYRAKYYFENFNNNYASKIIPFPNDTIDLRYSNNQLTNIAHNNSLVYHGLYENNLLNTLKYKDINAADYEYDDAGFLKKVSYPNNFKVQYGYDECNLLNSIDFGHNSIHFIYNDSLKIQKVIYRNDNNSDTVTFEYLPYLAKYYDIYGSKFEIRYNQDGKYTEVIDPYAKSQKVEYSDNLKTIINKKGQSRKIEKTLHSLTLSDELKYTELYKLENGQIYEYIDKKGNNLSIYHNSGKIEQIIDFEGNEHDFAYSEGQISSYETPEGIHTFFKYNEIKEISEIEIPDIGSISIKYDEAGNITNLIENQDTEYKFIMPSNFSDKLQITYPDNSSKYWLLHNYNIFQCDGISLESDHLKRYNKASVAGIDFEGVFSPYNTLLVKKADSINIRFDSLYRNAEISSNISEKKSYVYDVNNNIIKEYRKSQLLYEYQYDPLDRLTAILYKSIPYKSYAYDINSNLILFKKYDSFSTTYQYDKNNIVTSFQPPSALPVSYERNQDGLIKIINSPNNNKYIYKYDNLGRKQAISLDDIDIMTYEFNSLSDLRTNVDSIGISKSYLYTKSGLLQYLTINDSTRFEFAYDANSILNSFNVNDVFSGLRISAGNRHRFFYNFKDSIIIQTQDNLLKSFEYKNRTTEFKYNKYKQLNAINYHGGQASYIYDNEGRLTKLNDNGLQEYNILRLFKNIDGISGPISTNLGFDYNSDNAINSITNASESTYRLNRNSNAHRIISIIDPEARKIDYTYENGKIATISNDEGTYNLNYNKFNRLDKIIDPEFRAELITHNNFGYLTKIENPFTTINYKFDALYGLRNANSQASDLFFTYDNSLRITSADYGDFKVNYNYNDYGFDIKINLELMGSYNQLKDSIHLYNKYLNISEGKNSITLTKNNSTTHYLLNAFNKIIEAYYSHDYNIDISYDELGRIRLKDFPSSYFELYTYNSSGDLRSIKNSNRTLYFDHYQNSLLKSIIFSAGDSLNYSYNSLNLLSSISLPDKPDLLFLRDKAGFLRSIKNFQPSDIQFEYSDEALTITSGDHSNIFAIDDAFRVGLVPESITQERLFNNSGFPRFKILNDLPMEYNYYENATLKSLEHINNKLHFIYSDNLIKAVEKNRSSTLINHNIFNKIESIALDNGSEYSFDYNNLGAIKEVKKDNNEMIRYVFDPFYFISDIYFNGKNLSFIRDVSDRVTEISLDSLTEVLRYDIYGNVNRYKSNVSVDEDYYFNAKGEIISIFKGDRQINVNNYEFGLVQGIDFPDEQGISFRYTPTGGTSSCLASMNISSETRYIYHDELIESITTIVPGHFLVSEYIYNEDNEQSSYSTHSGFTIDYYRDNNSITIDYNRDSIHIEYFGLDTVKIFYPNNLSEHKIYNKFRKLVEYNVISNEQLIYSEIYEYDNEGNLSEVYKNDEVFELNYSNGTIDQIIKNDILVLEYERNELGLIERKIEPNIISEYNYDNNLNLSEMGEVLYYYDNYGYLIKKINKQDTSEYFYSGSGNLSKIVVSGDTTLFGYDCKDNIIYIKNNLENYITVRNIENDSINIAELSNSIGEQAAFIYDGNINLPYGVLIGEDTYFYHRGINGSVRLITDADGNVVFIDPTDILGNPLPQNGNDTLLLAILDKGTFFNDLNLIYKDNIFYDTDCNCPIQQDFTETRISSLLDVDAKEDNSDSMIKLKPEDVFRTEPLLFKYKDLSSFSLEKDLLQKLFDQQFNGFENFNIFVKYFPENCFLESQNIELPFYYNLDNHLKFDMYPALSKELNDPLIRDLLTQNTTITLPEIKVPETPLEKIIYALKLIGDRYGHLIQRLENIAQFLRYQYYICDRSNISELPYSTLDLKYIFSEEANENTSKLYNINFDDSIDWIDYLQNISNSNLRKYFELSERYLFKDPILERQNYGIAQWYYDIKDLVPALPKEYEIVNEVDDNNFKRIFMLTDVRYLLDNKMFVPGQTAYESDYLQLPTHKDYEENTGLLPLKHRYFNILAPAKQENNASSVR